MDEFIPSPGRIVLVKSSGIVRPAIVIAVDADKPTLIRVACFTGNDYAEAVVNMWVDKRESEDDEGWYRPGDWPQPTEVK